MLSDGPETADCTRLRFEETLTDHSFALCLTHDVDRLTKTPLHALFYAASDRDPSHLLDALPSRNPYRKFDTITDLEDDLGVRSAFYFLLEPPLTEQRPRRLLNPDTWIQSIGRYDMDAVRAVLSDHALAERGWELGLHGSYYSAADPDRLAVEKERLERLFERPIVGGRQHYLNIDSVATWRYHRRLGLHYDASLGSASRWGFEYGYGLLQPFDDEFVVFPTTLMERTLPDPGDDPDRAWTVCENLLQEAAANGAVMTVLWHPRFFSQADFPGYHDLYRRLVERARELNAWIGPPGAFYERYVRRKLSQRA